ncbi:MAG: hypothetical protein L0H79_05455 [Intrasporangium sp.]|uniref:hypothetical protein n=1 Tax=Intrasporangium sp. TaxID=1925024 RepID=UPI002647EC41|nr:hypothetical protein [Intrasporangium sp.]MDN5795183.1 hypothetical protein [Intrasporangium sp.]
MNTRTTTKLAIASAIAGLVPLGLAVPAQAATVVSHDGCTITVDAPEFRNVFNAAGAKLFDYDYHLTCAASAAGVSVEVRPERWESDLVGRAGDPDAPDEFTGRSTQNLSFAAAGQTRNIIVRATLPAANDDTDVPLEMFQVTKFRVTSGAVTGTWSSEAIGNSRALTP